MTDEQLEAVEEMQSVIVSKLGVPETLEAVINQLDYCTRRDIFAEIMRVHEIEE